MKKINETDSLNELILLQEQQHDTELRLLKEQFHVAYESVKPFNLIRSLVHDVTSSPEIKNDVVSYAMGLASGFISKKALIGDNPNNSFFKKMLGIVLQFTVANTVAKHTDDIKAVGLSFLDYFLKRSKI